MSRNPELSAILHILLQPTWVATGLKVEYDVLVCGCHHCHSYYLLTSVLYQIT